MAVADQKPLPAPSRWPRWPKVLLIASLALNVLVVGAIAGAWFKGGPGMGRGGGVNIFGYLSSLSSERRAAILKASSDLREQARPLRQVVRQAQRERAAALLAEPFDRQRYINAQTRQIEAETKLRLLARDITAEAAAAMSLDERKAYLRWRDSRRGPASDEADPEVLPGKRK
jgi:uncharacterized membrane protein